MFTVRTFNKIAQKGLDIFPNDAYRMTTDSEDPDAILLRSQNLHEHPVTSNLRAIARAGAGTNNIPIDAMSEQGIVVFNTPGANANAVKELVVAGMLMASRNLCQAWDFTRHIDVNEDAFGPYVEKAKKEFVGSELPGRSLVVVGLGAIGVKVANAAVGLGMRVIGVDPHISVQNAWQLSSQVERATDLKQVLPSADFLTVHVPYSEKTHHLINSDALNMLAPHAIVLNFARGGLVDEDALVDLLNADKIKGYVTDFPTARLIKHQKVTALPHLGASTHEAEENCATMAAMTLRDFLENGNIRNSVNFPTLDLGKTVGHRLAIANRNVPNVVGRLSTLLGDEKFNILDMLNKSRGDYAFTLVDVDKSPKAETLEAISAIDGILRVSLL